MPSPIRAANAEKTAPIEKQMMKKSPDDNSRIRQTTAIAVHNCHTFAVKYSIIVIYIYWFNNHSESTNSSHSFDEPFLPNTFENSRLRVEATLSFEWAVSRAMSFGCIRTLMSRLT